EHLSGGQLEKLGHLLHRLGRDPVVLVLHEVEHRQQAGPLRRVAREENLPDVALHLLGQQRLTRLHACVAAILNDPAHRSKMIAAYPRPATAPRRPLRGPRASQSAVEALRSAGKCRCMLSWSSFFHAPVAKSTPVATRPGT